MEPTYIQFEIHKIRDRNYLYLSKADWKQIGENNDVIIFEQRWLEPEKAKP